VFNGNNNQINVLGNLSAFTPAGVNSLAYTNLLTGSSGLTGLNTNLLSGNSGLTGLTGLNSNFLTGTTGLTGLTSGSDQINIGSEASGLLGTGTTGGTDFVTSFIMQMISKLTSNSNTLAQQLLSGSTTAPVLPAPPVPEPLPTVPEPPLHPVPEPWIPAECRPRSAKETAPITRLASQSWSWAP